MLTRRAKAYSSSNSR